MFTKTIFAVSGLVFALSIPALARGNRPSDESSSAPMSDTYTPAASTSTSGTSGSSGATYNDTSSTRPVSMNGNSGMSDKTSNPAGGTSGNSETSR